MKGYFDIHCHILPGIDDGATDKREMIRMLQIAYKEGIRTMIATPHYHPRRGQADAYIVEHAWRKACSEIQKVYPDMEIYAGNEIYYRRDAGQMLRNGELLTLAGSDYVLVEFSLSSAEPEEIMDGVKELQMMGYLPIIAHVERYDSILGDVEYVEELVEAGAYIQVNAGSVIGELGGNRKRFIKKLLKNECVHFIGTDAHDAHRRTPSIKNCAAYIEKKFGEEMAEVILYDNPSMIIKNEVI